MALGAADAIFVMGYDYRTSGVVERAGSVDPLAGPGYDLADTIRAYTARVSPSRIILGLPWYGRAWSTADTASARRTRQRGEVRLQHGRELRERHRPGREVRPPVGRPRAQPVRGYRRQNCTSAYGCVTSWRQVYYDDAASMKQRFSLVNDYGLRGAGMWALGYDGGRADLYRAVSESFLVDKSAPRRASGCLAATQGDEGFVVSWAARDTSCVVSYDVQVSTDGGAWRPWLTATRATSDVWLGADGHGYAFRVRAVDSKRNAGAVERGRHLGRDARAGDGRLRARGQGRAGLPRGSRHQLGQARHARGRTRSSRSRAARSRRTASPGTRSRSRSASGRRCRSSSAASGSRRGRRRRPSSGRTGRRTRPPSTPACADLDFGSGPATGVGTGAPQLAARAFSPNGDHSRDAIRLRWTQHPRPRLAHAPGLPHERHPRRDAVRPGQRRRRADLGLERHRRTARS